MNLKIFSLLPLLVMMVIAMGCTDDGSGNTTETKLKGTKWKLAGFFDVETNTLKEAEPKDCETCYTLSFDTDSTGFGTSVLNQLRIDLLKKPFIGVVTLVDDTVNGNVALFYEAIEDVISYKHEKNELIFFYNNNKKYLLYKLVE